VPCIVCCTGGGEGQLVYNNWKVRNGNGKIFDACFERFRVLRNQLRANHPLRSTAGLWDNIVTLSDASRYHTATTRVYLQGLKTSGTDNGYGIQGIYTARLSFARLPSPRKYRLLTLLLHLPISQAFFPTITCSPDFCLSRPIVLLREHCSLPHRLEFVLPIWIPILPGLRSSAAP
jgi:hypothetical protein